ncbi:hypothetical protein [Halopseudomonas sp.]|jgi:hypothetical protein|uniref:hypothetical protein n=1 Tax=Halopseudomonas sp. TaxID=2901191 RepID=UPI0039E48B60
MSMIKTLCISSLAGLLLTGCLSSGGGGGSSSIDQGGDDGGAGGSTSFTTLVKSMFAATSNTTEPVAINGLNITFDDQENEDAFSDLLSQP